jgi:hypothetical protein
MAQPGSIKAIQSGLLELLPQGSALSLGWYQISTKCHICVDEGPQRKSCPCFPVFSVWCNNINTSGDLIVEHSLGCISLFVSMVSGSLHAQCFLTK